MLFRISPALFWNLLAKKYASSPIQDTQAYENKLQKIRSFLTSDQRVLDIGCATGTQCGDIAGQVKLVTGIDISRKLLAIAEQRMAERQITNVQFRQTTMFDEQFQPGDFDVIMAFYLLHFVADIDVVLQHIHNLLSPGGLFISETACLGERSKILRRTIGSLGWLGLLPRIKLLTTEQLEQALIANGFKLLDKTKFSQGQDAEFTLIAQKV